MSRTRGDGVAEHWRSLADTGNLDIEADQASLYAYTILAPSSNVELTLGVSYDVAMPEKPCEIRVTVELRTLTDEVSQLNPKLGIRAEVMDGLVLRGRSFERRSAISCRIRRLNPRP